MPQTSSTESCWSWRQTVYVMHVDESGDLQQLKRAKIRYLYLSLPGCPSLSAVGIFPFILPFFLLRDFSLISRWWRSRRGRSRRGSSKSRRGPLCGRLGGAVGIHCRGSRAEWVAASAGQIKAAVSYNMIQLQFIMSNEAKEATPQQCRPFDDRILDDDYMETGKKCPVYTKLYVHISTDTLVDSRPFPPTMYTDSPQNQPPRRSHTPARVMTA